MSSDRLLSGYHDGQTLPFPPETWCILVEKYLGRWLVLELLKNFGKRLPSTMSRYVNIFFCSFKIIKQRKSISQYIMWSKRNLGPNKVKLTKYLDVIHYFFPVWSKLVSFVYFTSVIVVTLSSPNHSLSVIFRKLLRHWTRLSQEVTFHRPDPPQLWLQWEWNCMFLVDWVEIVDGWMIYTLLILVCVI